MLVFSALWALLLCQLLTSTFAQVRFTHSRFRRLRAGDGGTFRPDLQVTLNSNFLNPTRTLRDYILVWSLAVARRCRVFRTIP